MYTFSPTLILAFLNAAFAVPVGRGFFIPTDLDPQLLAEIPPHCHQIEADLEACYLSTQTTEDVNLDTENMRKCICEHGSFSMEKVTSCTDDPFAWLSMCGDELARQESELGLDPSI